MKRIVSIIIALFLSFIGSNINAQTKAFTISGRVTSFEESLALEGVSIHIKDTKNNTGTMPDGTFSIDVDTENKILVFEYKDYETLEVVIKGTGQYNVSLKRNATAAAGLKVRLHNPYTIAQPEATVRVWVR